MRRGAGVLLAVLLAVGLVALLPGAPAAACSCAPTPSLDEAADQFDVVLAGEVTRNEEIDLFRRELDVAVDEVWKGEAAAEQLVVTPAQGPSCGIDPAEGSTMVLLASRATSNPADDFAEPDELVVGSCWGPWSAAEVTEALGPGRPPDEPAADAAPPDEAEGVGAVDGSGDATAVVVLAGVVVAVVGVALIVVTRRRAGAPKAP